MRVIAGEAKGLRLHTPKGLRVRPTSDRARESLFSILGSRLPGARFLDLYAGTGANGIEALSRGTRACVFVDEDARSVALIKRNLVATGFEDRATVIRGALPEQLKHFKGKHGAFDIIFADPPYVSQDYETLLAVIDKEKLLAETGLMVVEHASRRDLAAALGDFVRIRRAKYGDTALSFYRASES